MSLIKTSRLFFILTVCALSQIKAPKASEDEGSPVATLRSPSTLVEIHNTSPYHSPVRLSPSKAPRQHKVFKRDTPFYAHELGLLLDPSYKEIHLKAVFVGQRTSEGFVPLRKSSLTISPETINPDVEVLSLSGCGLSDSDLEGISRFKKLRRLNLDGNRIGDACIPYITAIEGLESLSIAVTKVSDVGLEQLVQMRSLRFLDVARNKGITDAGEKFLSVNPNLKVDARFTSITDKTPRDY